MADLNKITAKKVSDNKDLKKIKLLFTQTAPKVEKAVQELENTLQQYSRLADHDDLEDLTEQVEAITEEATRFTDAVGELYDDNEGYTPGLSGHEKATTDIKPFSAGSDVTIFEVLSLLRDTDAHRMRRHIDKSSLHDAMYPVDKRDGRHFNPIDVPLLNILAMEVEQEYGWKYPSQEALQEFQVFWGLGDRMLKK